VTAVALDVHYQDQTGTALLTRGDVPDGAWTELRRVGRERGGVEVTRDRLELPWLGFLSMAPLLRYLQRQHGFETVYDDPARERLQRFVEQARQLQRVEGGGEGADQLTDTELYDRLQATGWDRAKRELTPEQLRDVKRMLRLANGANFSVPGAGKTTSALAVTLVATPPETRLLVVAPKNAFAAWDDEVLRESLLPGWTPFVRLTGGERAIREELLRNPARSLISYAQLVRVEGAIVEFMNRNGVHLVLDESHRIKAGQATLSGAVATRIGPLAVRRDILSGTPMPQSILDLASQLEFLWPAHGLGARVQAAAPSAAAVIRPFYSRTTKSELHLPPVKTEWVPIDMSEPQRLLYGTLRDDFLRQLAGVTARSLPARAAGPALRLLQAVTDPQVAVGRLIASGYAVPGTDLSEIYRLVIEEERSPRFMWVEEKARELVGQGSKVVIWSPFRETIRRLLTRLEDLGAQAIDGSTPAGSEDEDDTREGIIKRFHDDPEAMVLIANPAAGGEGVSFHRVCHHAIYLGRTYNAAHFLQSRDRIHRLGLQEGTETFLYITESTAPRRWGSIDNSVRRRLRAKVDAMSAALEDEDLRQLSLESDLADPTLDDGFDMQDLRDLIVELRARRDADDDQ
jgi:SNF2 family DNA or RNA helicase